jgi:hypothetical protein
MKAIKFEYSLDFPGVGVFASPRLISRWSTYLNGVCFLTGDWAQESKL